MGEVINGTLSSENEIIGGTLSQNGQIISGTLASLGIRGYSAYEVAVKDGYTGSVSDWLYSLRGSSIDIKVENNIVYFKNIDDDDTKWQVLVDLSGIASDISALQSGKVDKVSGKSLISDTEIVRLASVYNYNDTELRNLISTLDTRVTNLINGDVTNLKSQVTQILADIVTINSSLSSLQSTVNKLNGDITVDGSIRNQLKDYVTQTEKTTLENRIAEKADATALTTEVNRAKEKEDELSSTLTAHNSSSTAHSDIRSLIASLSARLSAIADSDDTTLDQLSEIVAYIKNNKTLIDTITSSKVNVSDIIDNLTSDDVSKPLSAKQGKVLKALIDAIIVPTKISDLTDDIVLYYEDSEETDEEEVVLYSDFESAIAKDIESISVNHIIQTKDANKNVNITIPTKVSQLEQDVELGTGKIDSISVNGVAQTIDENKNVNLVITGDTTYDDSATYEEGTLGYEVKQLKTQAEESVADIADVKSYLGLGD